MPRKGHKEKCPNSSRGHLRLGHAAAFLIGLFCMESMHYERFIRFLEAKGIDIRRIKKFEVAKGRFTVLGEDGSVLLRVPVKELEQRIMNCKRKCDDFTAEMADISVGAVGAPKGWSTVIVRTGIGEEVFRGAIEEGYLEASHVSERQLKLDVVAKLGLSKKGFEVKAEPESNLHPTARA